MRELYEQNRVCLEMFSVNLPFSYRRKASVVWSLCVIPPHSLVPILRHVDDIDLFPALIGEETGDAQLVGPTIACLLGRQFHVLKFGDRFWYENGIGDQAFTKGKYDDDDD